MSEMTRAVNNKYVFIVSATRRRRDIKTNKTIRSCILEKSETRLGVRNDKI